MKYDVNNAHWTVVADNGWPSYFRSRDEAFAKKAELLAENPEAKVICTTLPWNLLK